MTVTTDLFLPPSSTAPTGSSDIGASLAGNGSQNTVENDPDRFKKHLAQKTDNKTDKKTDIADKQSSDEQATNSSTTLAEPENVNRQTTDNSGNNNYTDPSYIQQPESEETSEANSQAFFNIQTGQNETTQTKPETPGTTITPPPQTGQKENIGASGNEKTPVNTPLPQQANSPQGQNITSITNTTDTGSATQTTDSQNIIPAEKQETPVPADNGIIKKTASENPETTRITSASARGPEDAFPLSKPLAKSLEKQNITNQNISVTEKAAPSDVRQTPDTTSQQIAGSVGQKEVTNSNGGRETVKNFDTKKSDTRKSDNGNNIAAADGEKQAILKDNAETSSQNSTKDNSSAKTVSAHGSATANPQASLSVKVPFLTELGNSMTGAEGKAGQPLTLQLPPGLLSLQEAGQNASLNNSLTATGQIKPHMPPVNPQMVAGQVSMAIAKQAGNGLESFRISLKPAELGQVDIRMDFQTEGRMVATVTVDNERTLTLLQRDQGALEKALENAGFDVGSDNLNFTLKKQQQNQGQSEFADNKSGENGENGVLPGSIISQQQMKMAYSDNILDINI